VSRTHPGFLTVIAKMHTCVLGQYWAKKDDVSQEHKDTNIDKNADLERPKIFRNT